MRSKSGLKPQDVVILLKIVSLKDRPWRLLDIANELGLSQGEISFGLERLKKSKLIDGKKKKPMKQSLLEFVLHGVKYMYPVEPGPLVRGIPTAHSAQPLKGKIISSNDDQFVWADSEGEMRGQHIEPLYQSVPFAVKKDPILHKLLALVDAIRVGRSRERKLAITEFIGLINKG